MSLVQAVSEQVHVESNMQQQQQSQQQSQQKLQRQSQSFWGWIFNKVTRQRLEGAVMVAVTAAALIAIGRRYRRSRKEARGFSQKCLSLSAIRGGRSVLQRVLDAQHAQVDNSTFQKAKEETKELLSNLSSKEDMDFNKLERLVAKMEMSGKDDEAVKILKDARDKAWENKQVHEAYELDMLLVEMLIYGGDLKSAKACKCLQQDYISDARRPLYKAVFDVMEGNIPNAEKNWQEFLKFQELCMRRNSEDEAQALPEACDDFKEFQTIITSLKKEIEKKQPLKL
ncbi:uncharacterized protein [Aristolochia californica]|uniref:uncharacterized protein n=1 Tax=Aristolochia californica TaxID=171875 RepID=UPI0035D8F808